MIALVLLTAPVIGPLTESNVQIFILLVGLVAILGVLTVWVLLADALTRPLVGMAVSHAPARDEGAQPGHESDKLHDKVGASQPNPQRERVVSAALESTGASWRDRKRETGPGARLQAHERGHAFDNLRSSSPPNHRK